MLSEAALVYGFFFKGIVSILRIQRLAPDSKHVLFKRLGSIYELAFHH